MLMSSSDERPLKVDHHSDRPVQDRRAALERDLVNQFDEAIVDGLILSSDQAVQEWVRHAVPQQRMEDVELREGVNEASEGAIAFDQGGVGEERDGAGQAKDDDVVAVVPKDVVRLL